MQDPWTILGVMPGASARQIHAAWRKGVSHWHPDRNPSPDATVRLQAINDAYACLRDGGAVSAAPTWAPAANAILSGLSGTEFGESVAPTTVIAADALRVSIDIPAMAWLLDEPITLAIPGIADVFTLMTLLHPAELHDGSTLVFRRAGLSLTGLTTDLLVTLRIAMQALRAAAPKPLAARTWI